MNKSLEEKYLNVIEDNVNVGKTNVGSEFLILISGIFALCFLLYSFADTIGNFFIDRMSDETQVKIENAFSFHTIRTVQDKRAEIKTLEDIRDKIVPLDKKLQGKSKFPIYEINAKEINAFVTPNGTIFFTKGLLNEVQNKETLTFILAHELGHYAHRDHLKTISRQIITSAILSMFSAGNHNIDITIGSISDLNNLSYSRKQEKEADLYANKIVYKLYGNNNGAVEFFKFLNKKENISEYLHYFSTHPSTKQRLNLINK